MRRGGKGEGGGRVGGGSRPMNAASLGWVRYGVEFPPAATLGALSLSVFSLCFLFPSFLQLYLVACTQNSVSIRPVCINARDLRELRHDLVCITMLVA